MLNWNSTKDESKKAHLIAVRANRLNAEYPVCDAEMDIIATHLNGCPLRLDELLTASDADFAHDVFGIRRFLDRQTGALGDCFDPRYSVPSA